MNASPETHPAETLLQRFALGKLDDSAVGPIVDHLERCVDCRRLVAELPDDSFAGKVRAAQSPDGTPAPNESAWQKAESKGNTRQPIGSQPAAVPSELADLRGYEIRRKLGEGGMGVVYLAHNTAMNRPEVLKVMNKSLVGKSEAVERFRQEIQSAAQLLHANVATAFSVHSHGDLLVLAMEYVDGADLSKVVRERGPLPVANACYCVHQVAMGLQRAHEMGMVHRDIKPGNILLSKQGKRPIVKVIDFGLAKARSEIVASRELTGTNQMMGTPGYSAPEQLDDAKSADIRSDIYALGCTLYYLLTGEAPFKGNSAYAIVVAQAASRVPPLRDVRSEIPDELAAIAAKMMAKEPEKRFQIPSEVAAALVPFIKGAKTPSLGNAGSPSSGKFKDKQSTMVRTNPSPATLISESGPWSSMAGDEDVNGGKSVERKPSRSKRSNARIGTGTWLAAFLGLVMILGLVALGGFVLRVKTPTGTIEIANVPSGAEVSVDGGKVELNSNGNRVTVNKLSGGSHQLKVTYNGQEILSRDVTIKIGDEPTRISVEPSTAKAETPPSVTPQPERTNGDDGHATKEKSGDEAVSNKPVAKPASPSTDNDGFVKLFNGKNLDGWKVDGGEKSDWQVKNGELVATGTANDDFPSQGYLLSDKDYKDFDLRFEFLQVERDDATSGVALRAKPGELASTSAPENRREGDGPFHLTIWLGDFPKFPPHPLTTGHLWYSANTELAELLRAPDRPADMQRPGVWNRMAVELRGYSLRFLVNRNEVDNVKLNNCTPRNPAPGLKRLSGRIGFMKRTGEVRFRNIEIKELAARDGQVNSKESAGEGEVQTDRKSPQKLPARQTSTDEGFVPLFNGKNLDGWQPDGAKKSDWQVKNGELVTTGSAEHDVIKQSYLLTEKDYKDFILSFDFLQVARREATSGIALRAVPGQCAGDSYRPKRPEFYWPYHLTIWLGDFDAHDPPLRSGVLWWSPDSYAQKVRVPNRPATMNKVGVWNRMKVEIQNHSMHFYVNDNEVDNVKLNDCTPRDPAPGLARSSGRIGFMKRTGEVRFRNIKIKELTAKAAEIPRDRASDVTDTVGSTPTKIDVKPSPNSKSPPPGKDYEDAAQAGSEWTGYVKQYLKRRLDATSDVRFVIASRDGNKFVAEYWIHEGKESLEFQGTIDDGGKIKVDKAVKGHGIWPDVFVDNLKITGELKKSSLHLNFTNAVTGHNGTIDVKPNK